VQNLKARFENSILRTVRIRLGTLRKIIREVGANNSWPGQPMRNALSPDINSREQLGALSAKAMDTVDDPEDLPNHLFEPLVDPEDCYGPVPPVAENPYVGQDPFVRDYAPQPFSRGGSIRRG
jgi:hypothetical protein